MEDITKTKFEDAAEQAETFLDQERNVSLDGSFAADTVLDTVDNTKDTANAVLRANEVGKTPDLFVPLSKRNAHEFELVAETLPGYVVLVPSSLVGKPEDKAFYPAIISADKASGQHQCAPGCSHDHHHHERDEIRLHVLQHKFGFQGALGEGAKTILSAAVQSETEGIGDHGRLDTDGVEAEHFPTLLAISSDPILQARWQAGHHVNHTWREQKDTSVLTQVNHTLLGSEVPQATISITRSDVEAGKAAIFWHPALEAEHGAETGTKPNALVLVQALGYSSLVGKNPNAIDNVRRILSE